jgi:hypothetical protein
MNPLIVTRAPADVLPWSSAATTSSGTRSRVAILPRPLDGGVEPHARAGRP